MKKVALFLLWACLLAPALSFATNTPPPVSPWAKSDATSSATANPTSDSASTSSSSANVGAPNYANDSNYYVLPAPISGGNLPSGMCQTSKYHHFGVFWNFVSVADGDSHTDMECLKLLTQLRAMTREPRPLPPQLVGPAHPPQVLPFMTPPSLSITCAVPTPPAPVVKPKVVSKPASKPAAVCK